MSKATIKNRLFIVKAHNYHCSSGLITRFSRYFQFLVNRKSPITNRAFISHGIHFSVLKYYVDGSDGNGQNSLIGLAASISCNLTEISTLLR